MGMEIFESIGVFPEELSACQVSMFSTAKLPKIAPVTLRASSCLRSES